MHDICKIGTRFPRCLCGIRGGNKIELDQERIWIMMKHAMIFQLRLINMPLHF